VDADWTVPNWQAAVAAIRPVAAQHGIPFGMVYNGFLTNETDSAWMTAAENHFVDYEVRGGNAAPDQVNFQSWNPHPTHVLPETDPTAFTYLIDRYFRTRTQLTLTNNGAQLSGTLRAGPAVAAGVNIQITAQPVSGNGAIATYTTTGPVPMEARTAIVGARINSECYSCNGPSDLTIYSFQYSENAQGTPYTWNFLNGISGWLFGGPRFSISDSTLTFRGYISQRSQDRLWGSIRRQSRSRRGLSSRCKSPPGYLPSRLEADTLR
jgi:hypothetical protein